MNEYGLPDLPPEQMGEVIRVCESILYLTEHPGWTAFQKMVEAAIEQETPKPHEVMSADNAIQIASRSAYVAGMRRVLMIPQMTADQLKALKELKEIHAEN